MSLRDRIHHEAKEGGYRPHPLGTFPATVEEVVERHWEDKTIYEVVCRTEHGTAKSAIWKTTMADVEDRYGGTVSRQEAEDRYCRSLGRICRLYTDLGLEEPDGPTDEDMEEAVYGRLGELIGRACTVIVQASQKKEGAQTVFVNAPKGGVTRTVTKGVSPRKTQTAAPAAANPADFDNLNDIPF